MTRKKIGLIILVSLAILTISGGIYVYKNISETPPVTIEQEPQPDTPTPSVDESSKKVTTLSGSFKGADAVHSGSGSVNVTEAQDKAVLSFGDDFAVTQGPDLFVYLSPNAPGEDLGEFASLGKLKAQEGTQTYSLPANYKDYKTVVIWCKAFGVTFATAELQ